MRKFNTILIVAICGALALAWAQKTQQTQPRSKVRPTPSASEGKNKEVARQVFDELFSKGRYELIDQIYAPGCVVHTGNKTLQLNDAVEEGKGWRSAAPDLTMTADRMGENGDLVTVWWTAKGTHTGTGNGIPATGKHVQMHGTSKFRFVNGKIAEVWNSDYNPELRRQLGVSGHK